MKEELDIGIFIYGTVKATAPVAGQSEKKVKKWRNTVEDHMGNLTIPLNKSTV